MSQRKIQVVKYDPQWELDFKKEKGLLKATIGNTALRIDHIGSTSIYGLSAKPIIDLLIEVSNLDEFDERSINLVSIGYAAKGENGIVGRRYFQKGGINRTHHIHAFLSGDHHLVRHRAFKEYLIAHPRILKDYDVIKTQAVQNCNNDIALYMSLKNDFIQEHEKLALNWYSF